MLKKIAVFASGSGSNAENLFHFFKKNNTTDISVIVCNKKNVGVIERANRLGIELKMVNRESFYETDELEVFLQEKQIDLVVLAGFLWLIPEKLIQLYPNKIVNIHPALLPKYGGKGMYGSKVHEAVKMNNETETGITIHYVNEKYDEGAVIFQAKCAVTKEDTPKTIAQKVHKLEYKYYPIEVEKLISKQ